MRVVVVTPYYREDIEVLRQCHESVIGQSHPCTHLMVADGHPKAEIADWPVQSIVLPHPHGDVGNTPRAIGSLCAMNSGFDAIAYLDADNWYYPNHIEAMVTLHEVTGAAVCTAGRSIHRMDGSLMYVDDRENDGNRHVDTSCLFLTRKAFRMTPLWATMPQELGPNGDRVFWQALCSKGLPKAHNPEPTVAFRTQYDVHYQNLGEEPPIDAKTVAETTGKAGKWWLSLDDEERKQWSHYFSTGQW